MKILQSFWAVRATAASIVLQATILFAWGQAEPARQPAEESVKPGINDRWKSPEIEPLVETLESESREIYIQREELARLTGPARGSTVADIGSGSGFMVEEFAELVGPQGRVYAVDINPKMLERIDKRARGLGLSNIQTILGEDDSVELPPNSVDMIFICDTYHHFEYPKSVLSSIREALRPGGEMVVVDFKRVPGESPDWVLEHVRGGKDLFTREIVEAGFKLVSEHEAPFLEENYVLRFQKPR